VKINLTRVAKRLRSRQTDTGKVLWYKICNRQLEGVKFRRQQQIGNYIVDFVCFERRIIVGVDGGQHNEPAKEVKDEKRAQYLH
jgi:very-short-patch-repair endonuclease